MGAITSPSIIGCLLELAEKHDGGLLPAVVVEAARSPTSPLHSCFDWDDSEAGQKWRIAQARHLLRVIVRYEEPKEQLVPTHVFVSLTPDREAGVGYRLTRAVLADPDLRRQLLEDARADMKRFTKKYMVLEELAAIFAAMHEFDPDIAPNGGDEASP